MGALVVDPARIGDLVPALGGWFSFERIDGRGDAVRWPDARRFEATGYHRPSVVGMARSIGWLSMYVGLDFVHRRGTATAAAAAARLAAIPGVTVLTPSHAMATLVTFRIAGWPAQAALDELGSRVFAIARTIEALDALRISVGFFTSDEELERLAEAVALLAAHTPDTLPPRRVADHPGRSDDGAGATRRRAAAPAAAIVGRGPLAPVPQRAAAGRPRGRREPERGRRAGRRLPRLRPRAEPRSRPARRRPADAGRGRLRRARPPHRDGGDLPVVPQPTGSGSVARRSAWSAALGFFAAVPIAYLVLVVAVQVIRPLLG